MLKKEELEKKLRGRLAVLNERMNEIDDELEQPGDDDFEEMAVESADDQVLEGVGNAAQNEVRKIELALKRIDEGTFGKCAECGEAISPKRLEAVPHANFCIECEKSAESKK